MTYNPNIPQTGTRIDQTYNLITTNFGQLNTIFGNDHFTWNDASVANRGRHKKCTLVAQSAVPSGLASAGIAFSQINPAVNINRVDPYYKYDSSGIAAGLVPPLVPFKVFCEFTIDTSNVVVVSNAYNVTSVTTTVAGEYTINFTNNLTTDASGTFTKYLILASCATGQGSGINRCAVTYSTSDRRNSRALIRVTNVGTSGSGLVSVSVGIIQL